VSNHLAIATVTAALQAMLDSAVKEDVAGATATIVRPDGADDGLPDPGVNIYLYQVTPNTAWRNADLPTRNGDGRLAQLPRVALNLHYLLTFYGDDGELEPQRVLGSAVRALHSQPVLDRGLIRTVVNGTTYLNGSDLAQDVELVKLMPSALSLEEISKLWSVFFETHYTLSMAYQASVVLIEPEQRPVMAQPVREPVIQVQASPDPGGVIAAEPDSLPDLQLWLRADTDVSHDELASVSHWADQSGNGHHAFQDAAARRPTFARNVLNGKPVMRFDGVDDYFAIDRMHYDTQGQIGGITLFALVKSASAAEQFIISFDRSEYWRLSIGNGSSDGIGWHTRPAAGAVDDLITTTAYSDGKWHLLACRFAAGASPDKQIFADGEEVAAATAHGGESLGSGATRFGIIGVGSEAASADGVIGPFQYLKGELAEVLVYHRALSDVERRRIERYFVEKYRPS